MNLDEAKHTLDVTTQTSIHKDDPKVSRNYGTDNRMLRYKHISEYSFMDTFFATHKARKLTQGKYFCQIFVTDKGFVYVFPIKSKSEVLQAIKQFVNEIGTPNAIILDSASEKKP